MSIPTVTIVGNLTDAPKSGTGKSGTMYANFTVIAQSRRQDQSGQWVDGDKMPMRVSCFGQLAQNVAHSLGKGMRMIVQGRMRQTSYQTQDGQTRYQTEMTADAVGPDLARATAVVTRNQAQNSGNGYAAQQSRQQQAAPQAYQAPPSDPWGGNDTSNAEWGDGFQ